MIPGIRAVIIGLSSLVLAGYLAVPASAASYQVIFAASDISNGPPSPIVLGQVSFSFDPAHDLTGPVNVGFVDGLDMAAIGPLSYLYTASDDDLQIDGDVGGPGIAGGTTDIIFDISDFTTAPVFNVLFFTIAGDNPPNHSSHTGDVHVTISATPIPPALPLFISALGGLGLLGWWRRGGWRLR